MNPSIIVSYDDTANDRDALALARLLAQPDAKLSLAYVRHARRERPADEAAENSAADDLLRRGAEALGRPNAARHVVIHGSTASGLRELATGEHADVVIFGSEYRSPRGAVRPGVSAQRLLDGGPVAVAIAPAGMERDEARTVVSVATLPGAEAATVETARSLAAALGANLTESAGDLLVVGSREEAAPGRLVLSATTEHVLESVRCPVLALPRGMRLSFAARTAAPASAS